MKNMDLFNDIEQSPDFDSTFEQIKFELGIKRDARTWSGLVNIYKELFAKGKLQRSKDFDAFLQKTHVYFQDDYDINSSVFSSYEKLIQNGLSWDIVYIADKAVVALAGILKFTDTKITEEDIALASRFVTDDNWPQLVTQITNTPYNKKDLYSIALLDIRNAYNSTKFKALLSEDRDIFDIYNVWKKDVELSNTGNNKDALEIMTPFMNKQYSYVVANTLLYSYEGINGVVPDYSDLLSLMVMNENRYNNLSYDELITYYNQVKSFVNSEPAKSAKLLAMIDSFYRTGFSVGFLAKANKDNYLQYFKALISLIESATEYYVIKHGYTTRFR